MKESKVEIKPKNPNVINIDGIKYVLERESIKKIDGIEHSDKLVFKKFDEKEYKDNLKIVVDALFNKVTKEELLNELIGNIDMKTLRRLVRRIKTKKSIKRQDGCLGFKIGDAYIELID